MDYTCKWSSCCNDKLILSANGRVRVVAIAIDKLELMGSDRFRDANGVTILWVINYTLSVKRVIPE
ncbi:hypothetical protein [Nostoc sp.]